jgi:hypothetical protein
MPLAIRTGHEENHSLGSDIHIDDGSRAHGGAAARRRLSQADDIARCEGAEAGDACGLAARRFDNAWTVDCESRCEHARRWSRGEDHDQRVVSKSHENKKDHDDQHHHDFRSDDDDYVDDDHANNDDDAVAGAAEAAAQHQARKQAAVASAGGDESHGGRLRVP